MAKLNYPVLQFKSSHAAFLNFAGEYNRNKALKDQLRPQHAKMFARILTLLARQLYQHNKLFEDTPVLRQLDTSQLVKLQTNRKALSWVEKTIRINENSAYRQVNRLIASGVILKKINHGSQMNFELWINPKILLITDLLNPENEKGTEDPEDGNKEEYKALNTNFSPGYLIS